MSRRSHKRDPEKKKMAEPYSKSYAEHHSEESSARRGDPFQKSLRGGSVTERCTKGLLSLYIRLAPAEVEECNYAANRERLEAYRLAADRRQAVPRRQLTVPSIEVEAGSGDNEEADLICRAGDELEASGEKERVCFEVLDKLGKGSFGQVFRCRSAKTRRLVAIKVVKSKHAYRQQALVEAQLAWALGRSRNAHIVSFLGDFVFRNHVCLIFEALSMNMYELLKQNQFRGLPLASVRLFTRQIVDALLVLDEARIVHCDLKPENILLVPSRVSIASDHDELDDADRRFDAQGAHRGHSVVKVIDFGSACCEGRATQSYVQSRFYRAPEVLVSAPYDCAIDIWSCACVAAELMVGLPIFPGTSSHDQLVRIVDMFGVPPDQLLMRGADTSEFFHVARGRAPPRAPAPSYRLKTPEEYARDTRTDYVRESKKYFEYRRLADIIAHYPVREGMTPTELAKVKNERIVFSHFLAGLLRYAPHERWTPAQALAHPFLVEGSLDHWRPPKCKRAEERRLFAPWGGGTSIAASTAYYANSPSQLAAMHSGAHPPRTPPCHSAPTPPATNSTTRHAASAVQAGADGGMRFDKRRDLWTAPKLLPQRQPRAQSGLARQLAASQQQPPAPPWLDHGAAALPPQDVAPSMLMPPPQPGHAFGESALEVTDSPGRRRGGTRAPRPHLQTASSMGSIDERRVPTDEVTDEAASQHHYALSGGPPVLQRMLSLQTPRYYAPADTIGLYTHQHWQAYQLQQQQRLVANATHEHDGYNLVPLKRTMTMTSAQLCAANAQASELPSHNQDARNIDSTGRPDDYVRLSSSYTAPHAPQGRHAAISESDFSSALQRPKHRAANKSKRSSGSPRVTSRPPNVSTSSAPDFIQAGRTQHQHHHRRSARGGGSGVAAHQNHHHHQG